MKNIIQKITFPILFLFLVGEADQDQAQVINKGFALPIGGILQRS